MRKTNAEYARKWRERNPERAREVAKIYQKKHRDKIRQRRKTRRKELHELDPEKNRAKDRLYALENPGYIRAKGIRRYGLSTTRWLALFHFQDSRCAICRREEPGKRGWATDHDHQTGVVRGILCHNCNLKMGWLGDSYSAVWTNVQRILDYLLKS